MGVIAFTLWGPELLRRSLTNSRQALKVDKATGYGDPSKLETISIAQVRHGTAAFSIVNAYTQFHFRGRGPKVDYVALEKCFQRIADQFPGSRIGYPLIGAGLAGGDWNKIAPIIDSALEGVDHTLVVFEA